MVISLRKIFNTLKNLDMLQMYLVFTNLNSCYCFCSLKFLLFSPLYDSRYKSRVWHFITSCNTASYSISALWHISLVYKSMLIFYLQIDESEIYLCEVCSKLTTKTSERRYWLLLVSLLLTLNIFHILF